MKKKKIVKKRRLRYRLLFAFLAFGIVISILSYNFFGYIKQINDLNNEKKDIVTKIDKLKEEEGILNSDIKKLKDPNYISKYAREKYMYSKDGELIIRIDE